MEVTEFSLQSLLSLTHTASKATMEIYNTNTTVVVYKSDNYPLTQADKASHEIIVNGLRMLFPDIPVIGEKEDLAETPKLVNSPAFWQVDLIDGTQEFVNRNGEFCITIGLIENNKPTFGFASAPTIDTVYYGGAN